MNERARCFALGSLWLGVAALQVYHLHTGEVGWARSTVLALFVYVLGGCYYFGAGVRNAVRSRSY